LLGPSTLRDTGGLVVDYAYDPLSEISDDEAYWATFALRVIDTRVQLLGATRIMEQAAIDPYVFMRDAYLQHRRNLIYDGEPPREIMDAPPPSDEDLELERLLELDSLGR
jgi:phospholipid-binding lipoprotein MlaA